VLLEIPGAPLVLTPAGFPFAHDLRQVPADSQSQHEPALRELIEIGERIRQHGRLAQRRQQNGRSEAGPRGDRRQIGQRGERLEPGLGNDAVAHPQIHSRRVAHPRDRPALFDRRAPHRLQHYRAVWKEHA
jgi:hypothetical protein